MLKRTKLTQHAQGCIEMVNRALNDKHMFSIDSEWGGFMPHISKTDLTIKFSSRFEISSLLFLEGDFSTVLDYWLGLSSLENGDYSGSIFFMNQLIKKTNRISKKIKLYKVSKSGLLEYMTLFVVLHEVAHGIYTLYPELRSSAFSEIDKELTALLSSYSQCCIEKSSLIKDLNKKKQALEKNGLNSEEIMSKENLIALSEKELTDLDKASLKEELACDLYSLSIAVQIVEFRGGSQKEYLKFFKASMLALILISRYQYIVRRFVKLQDNERYAMNKDAELIRLQFYNNECLQGLKCRKINTTSYYNYIKEFPIEWLLDVNKYIDKYQTLIINSANCHNDQHIDNSYIERFETAIIDKYLI